MCALLCVGNSLPVVCPFDLFTLLYNALLVALLIVNLYCDGVLNNPLKVSPTLVQNEKLHMLFTYSVGMLVV